MWEAGKIWQQQKVAECVTTNPPSKPNWNKSEVSGSGRPCCMELHGSFGSEHTCVFHTVQSNTGVPGFCPGSQMAYYVCLPQSGHKHLWFIVCPAPISLTEPVGSLCLREIRVKINREQHASGIAACRVVSKVCRRKTRSRTATSSSAIPQLH